MENKELQVENGNFTRIINPVLDELVKIPFKGCELSVAIFIIRKTWGYGKTEDEISLTQFENGLKRSRQTIVTALKNLQLVNIARLVKQGDSKNCSNLYKINKYINTWELVNMARLVQRKRGTSLTEAPQLVKTARHTKENTKEIKERKGMSTKVDQSSLHKETTEFIDYFLAEYKRTQGRDFVIAGGWGRYIKQAQPFIKIHGLETMKSKAHNYLISSDNWYQTKNFTLGLLLTDETINNL